MAYIEEKSHGKGGHDHGRDPNRPKLVAIEVNSKPVVLDEKVMTGLDIKQTAMAQQVQIQLDFVLQLERPNGEWDPIGDGDEVHVKNGMNFTCIAPDDNS